MPFSSTLKAEQASTSMEGTEGVCGREGHLTKAGKTRDRGSCVWRIRRPLGRWCAGLGTETTAGRPSYLHASVQCHKLHQR